MRTAPLALASTLALALSCSPTTPAATNAAPPASGARVAVQYPPTGPGNEIVIDITPGADARLLLALGDRVSELDLTPATPNEKQADALVAFAPVKKLQTARVRVRARPWAGHEVMSAFVQPFGGDAGAKALAEAAPDFVKHKMIEVSVDVTVGERTQSTTRRIALALSDEPKVSTPYPIGDAVPFGVPVRIEDWVTASTGTAFVPAIHLRGTTLSAGTMDGKDVPLESLPAAVWTLWMQLEANDGAAP